MKLLKKLVPLGTVATITAGIVPMVTSCTSNSGGIDGTKSVDVTDFDRCPGQIAVYDDPVKRTGFDGIQTYQTATNQYVQNGKRNPNLVYDDFKYSLNQGNGIVSLVPQYVQLIGPELLYNLLYEYIPSEQLLELLIGLFGYSPLKSIEVNKVRGKLSDFNAEPCPYEPCKNDGVATYKQSIDFSLTLNVGLDYLPQILLDLIDDLIGLVPAFTLDISARVDCDLHKIPFVIGADPLTRTKKQLLNIVSREPYDNTLYYGMSFVPNVQNYVYLGDSYEGYGKAILDLDVTLKTNDIAIKLFGGNKQSFIVDKDVYHAIFDNYSTSNEMQIPIAFVFALELIGGGTTYYYCDQVYPNPFALQPMEAENETL